MNGSYTVNLFVAFGTNLSSTSLSSLFLGLNCLSYDHLKPYSQSLHHAFLLQLNGLLFTIFSKLVVVFFSFLLL